MIKVKKWQKEFSGITLVAPQGGKRGVKYPQNRPKWPKMALFCLLQKIGTLDFDKTCWKAVANWYLWNLPSLHPGITLRCGPGVFWSPDRGGIGLCNSLSFVRPSVRWFPFFSETVPWIFLKFCTNISHDTNMVLTEQFFRENSGCPPGGQKGGKIPPK